MKIKRKENDDKWKTIIEKEKEHYEEKGGTINIMEKQMNMKKKRE